MTKRKKRWMLFGVLLLALAAWLWFENKHLTVTRYSYESRELAGAFEDYRIVQISDLHNAWFGRNSRGLLDKIKQTEPDMIAITGDLVDANHTNTRRAVSFVEQAVELAPVYYITGNHEVWLGESEEQKLMQKIEAAGAVSLQNEAVSISKGDSSFTLIGLQDENLTGGTLNRIAKELDPEQLQVLLAHEPQYIQSYSRSGVDLVLSGHAHGGQFRLPFLGGIVAPDQGFLPKYTEGVHVEGDTTMIISRGLGNSVIPVRLFNAPEIVCVDLKTAE